MGPRGYDGGKKVKGRKRHLLVDTQGLIIKTKVHPADLHDKEGAKLLLSPLAGKLPRMAKVWADSAYHRLKKWLKETLDGTWRWCNTGGRDCAGCGFLKVTSLRLWIFQRDSRCCPGAGW
jgi:hypothetical protein